jgi:Xaa-Pro aminopeptidase
MSQVLQAAPTLSLGERDRRYAAIRAALKERGADCAIVLGSNLFYLSNGIAGERFGLLPADAGEQMMVVLNGRHLADIPAQVVIDSQEWIKDVRGANDAGPLIERIKELRLERGTIGLGDRQMPLGLYQQLQKALPEAKLVDVSDVFANVRTIKSDEEVALVEQANRVFDAGVQSMYERVRPGMTGAQAIQHAIQGMWAAGGDLDSTIGFNFGPVPKQNPVLGDLCLSKTINWGEIGTLTAHAEYSHYAGHTDQEISFGEPSQLHRDMFAAVLQVRDAVLKAVKPGATQRDLVETYRKAAQETGFKSSPHSQIHQYGIDVPEFPGAAFRVEDPAGPGGARLGSAGNYTLAAGMIYSISPTLVAPNGEDTLLGGTSLVITEDGYRELGDRKVEMLVVA